MDTKYVAKRGRPSKSQVKLIDNTILTVAKKLFLQNGYDAVAMEQVALQASVSKPTLYARYKTKTELFVAVITAFVTEHTDNREYISPEKYLSWNLETLLIHHAQSIANALLKEESIGFNRLIFSARDISKDELSLVENLGIKNGIKLFSESINQWATVHHCEVEQAELLAETILNVMFGKCWYNSYSSASLPPEKLTEYIANTVDLLMKGTVVTAIS